MEPAQTHGEALPGQEPAGGAEVLHESDRTRVSRVFLAGGTAVRKEPLGPDAQRRLEHELAMLERLRGVVGVAQLLAAPRYPGSIVLEDVGGTSLAGVAKPLAVGDLIGLAAALAGAVAGMHRRGVMHRDIAPANIVLSGDGGPCLVDFALATLLAELRPEFTHHTQIVGTLAYVAPEQTGRTGRSVDQRADLYALGATLYELATGEPPFGHGDPLRLTHDHLARLPVPPAEVNPAVPGQVSAIVLRLLEKEPDNRYQTADGVLYDLERLRDAEAGRAAAPFRIGEHDSPLRLLPPSRLVGRDADVAALEAAFEDAVARRCRGVVVSGPPGVGKTALVDRLRPVVAARGGWFVTGKFDQYRRDLEADAVYQAFRALGRLLLAEPEDELARVRERILRAVGPNAGLVTATSPELATLLAVPPDPGDPLTAQVRAQRTGVEVLHAVASRERPVVLFIDDLQWAGRTPLGFVDLMMSEEPVDGLLLVAAYRQDDVNAGPALAAPMPRWHERAAVRRVPLTDLPVSGSVAMVAEMLHADRARAVGLVDLIEPHTRGNPYETVELLNALRRDGVLTATAAGWRWEDPAVRAHLGQSEPAGLPAARINAMPPTSRALVDAMACLGGRAELRMLRVATATPASELDRKLAPVLREGLLVIEPGPHEAVRIRHDRLREAILQGLDPHGRRTLQLALARRLAGVPELFAVAAEQYLPVVDAVDDPAERRAVVGLLRHAAEQAAWIGDYAPVDELLAAALRLMDPGQTAALAELHTARHAALYSLGRLDAADEEYRTIERLCPDALERADATAVQVRSLTHRNSLQDAIGLGLESLRELGIIVPAADRITAVLDRQFHQLDRWLDKTEAAGEPARPDISDPAILGTCRVLDAILPALYFVAEQATVAWLSLEGLRIWIEHGPTRTLVGPAGHAALQAMALRGDYAAGGRAMRRILALSEARGYEPDASMARLVFAVHGCWFEPIEATVEAAGRAREGLIAGGDLANAGYTYHTTAALLDCGATLDRCVAEIEAGLAFVRRTGSAQTIQWLESYRWLVSVLRGESSAAAGETVLIDRYADNPVLLFHAHVNHAIAAAIFDDAVDLARHTSAAMPLLPTVWGNYATAVAHALRGLSLAGEARAPDGDERAGLLSERDDVTRWLAERAVDAPDNFLHLLRLVEAERAWAIGDFRAAAFAFDAARGEVAGRQRPWHRALIAERAARFYLAHGLDQAGYELLAQARHDYAAWGATAKVAQLDWAYPTLRPQPDAVVTTGTVDLLGILSASRALSSETSVEALHTRVVDVLAAMTGATGVQLLLWSDERQRWLHPGGPVDERAVPMAVLRYVKRTREPLVVADATRDERFARGPYFAGLESCSLLAVPILSRGTLHAVLVLENRLIRGAFTTERLDAVKLIAGQLAVSLDNAESRAQLIASRARIVAAADDARRRIQRDLHDGAQQRVVTLALTARALASSDAARAADLLDLATGLDDALRELRDISSGLHPAVLSRGGLKPTLTALARRSPIPVALDARMSGRLAESIEIAAYYLVAETLTNAAKHANASRVDVTAESLNGALRIRVQDDGIGGADPARGSGLIGLRDRVEALGGTISIDSPPGRGTTLIAELPLDDTAATAPERARA